ncbi:hypothetical protein GGI05_004703, partial [Coemansia sp. RSA 2603]
MSSYADNTTGKRAYDAADDAADNVHVRTVGSPSVDITSMQPPAQRYMPYAGAYSDSAWGNAPPGPRDSLESPAKRPADSLDLPGGATYTKPESRHQRPQSPTHSFIGFRRMSSLHALRFVFYVGTRLAQLVVALVCMAYLANSRHSRPPGSVDATERHTEVAVFVVGGVTAATALVSVVLHVFGRTRRRIEGSRVVWVSMVLNFLVFVTWIILVLINVVVVDCSRSADGAWCRDIKVSSATGLV